MLPVMCALPSVRVPLAFPGHGAADPGNVSFSHGRTRLVTLIYIPFFIFAFVSLSAVEQRPPRDAVLMCLFLLQELFWVCSDGI